MQSVVIVDILLALINLSLDPMSIQISEEMVVVLCGIGVSLPLTDVEGQERLVRVRGGCDENVCKMCCEILAQEGIELFTQQMSATVTLA